MRRLVHVATILSSISLAACGGDDGNTPGADAMQNEPDAAPASACASLGTFVEEPEETQLGITGFTLSAPRSCFTILGSWSAQPSVAPDVDIYGFRVRGGGANVVVAYTASAPARFSQHFSLLFLGDGEVPVRGQSNGTTMSSLPAQLADGDYELRVVSEHDGSTPLTYEITVFNDAPDCVSVDPATPPSYVEADESGAGHRANDMAAMINFNPPIFEATAAADSPEQTGLVIAAGDRVSVEGVSADVASDGDVCLDRDAFLVTAGPDTHFLRIVHDWPAGDANMEVAIMPADQPGTYLASRISNNPSETTMARVFPGESYWMWLTTYDDTFAGGATSLPVTYRTTVCGHPAP